jgi:hypothetical protein
MSQEKEALEDTLNKIIVDKMLVIKDLESQLSSLREDLSDALNREIILKSELRARESENKTLREDNENLVSVMIAAAEEIQQHWQAHCDEEGYGPANLMLRLEKGIPANYPGYKFGAFTKMQAEIDRLKSEKEKPVFTCRVCGEHEKYWSRKNNDWYCKTCGHICNPN